ncbi:hypothetical protein JOC77_001059 [Peribacillus deserti]|uniref:Uncharacterized protein n=1 Tax=Peribacillus deserti TaxID=673318 RepID=A0ABS2QET3_9BACI|nr:hypothetical protein [Peribacillus deserti]
MSQGVTVRTGAFFNHAAPNFVIFSWKNRLVDQAVSLIK